MSINSIDLSKLRNGEYSQFLLDVLFFVDKNDPAVLLVQAQYNQLATLSQGIEKLFKVDQGNTLSDELVLLDERRDNAINGISAMIAGHTYSPDATVKANARLLADHLAIFGTGIARDSYQSETASLRNIVNDWNNAPELGAALTALNLVPWKTEIATANTLFGEKYLARAEDNGKASPDTIKAKRLEANNAYYKLRDRINSYYDINEGADPFGKTVNSLNGLIENYNTLLSRRVSGEAEVVAATPVA